MNRVQSGNNERPKWSKCGNHESSIRKEIDLERCSKHYIDGLRGREGLLAPTVDRLSPVRWRVRRGIQMRLTLTQFKPFKDYTSALEQAAKLWGIDLFYWDIFGKKHEPTAEAIRAILSALGVDTASVSSLNHAMEARLVREWSMVLPEVEVVGLHGNTPPWVNVPGHCENATLRVGFDWEHGAHSEYTYALSAMEVLGKATLRRQQYLRLRVPMPLEVRMGYHAMSVEVIVDGEVAYHARTELIVTPERAYVPLCLKGNGKRAGIGLSLYSLRSRRNWGCGDFGDLRGYCEWVAKELNCSFVALNPLHLIANRLPYNASPYLPISIYFKNFIYLELERIPEYQRSVLLHKRLQNPALQQRIAQLRHKELVDYEDVAALKLGVLSLCFLEFRHELRKQTPRAQQFLAWCDEQRELLDPFTTFCALDRDLHRKHPEVWIWQDWPKEYQDPSSHAVELFAKRKKHLRMFYAWVQWLTFQQLEEAGEAANLSGLSIGLYHDMALATDQCGADVWAQREMFVLGCRVGAPPDDFSPSGQDWAFPPPNYEQHRQTAYKHFREAIRRNMIAGGALRIDHVMRFFRLYWIPAGFSASEGTYVRDYAENLVRILALESVRNQVVIIGEDLGTVEPATREFLERFGIYSYRLFYFERDESGAMKLPEQYPTESLVSTSTHDLPTLAGSWIGRDIEARDFAGLLPDHEDYERQWAGRRDLKQHILEALFAEGLMPDYYTRHASDIPELTGELHNATIGYLARTRSTLFQINHEDLVKALDHQNLPGSTWQYPNWRRKTGHYLEDLREDAFVRGCVAMLKRWLQETERQN